MPLISTKLKNYMERLKVKVAVYLFLIKDNKVFLLRRKNTGWQDGNYGAPAGHLDPNETMTQAVIREALEEIGVKVDLKDLKMIHAMHRVKSEYVDFFYVSKKWTGEVKNTEPEKCDDISQFDLNNLPSNIVPSVKSALENYKNGIFFSEFELEE